MKNKNNVIFLLTTLFAVLCHAEDGVLGTVQQIDGDTANVMFVANRPKVTPEELVLIRSRIPGIDETVESGKGYLESGNENSLAVVVTEGEPAIGDEVVLLMGEYLNGTAPKDIEKWSRFSYIDIRERAFKKKEDHNVGAACALGYKHKHGDGVEQDAYDAYLLFGYATRSFDSPPPDCAAEYGWVLLFGDQNDPPRWTQRPAEAERWLKYAAESGSYLGMLGYALGLDAIGEHRKSDKWFKAATKIEPSASPGSTQQLWNNVRANR